MAITEHQFNGFLIDDAEEHSSEEPICVKEKIPLYLSDVERLNEGECLNDTLIGTIISLEFFIHMMFFRFLFEAY